MNRVLKGQNTNSQQIGESMLNRLTTREMQNLQALPSHTISLWSEWLLPKWRGRGELGVPHTPGGVQKSRAVTENPEHSTEATGNALPVVDAAHGRDTCTPRTLHSVSAGVRSGCVAAWRWGAHTQWHSAQPQKQWNPHICSEVHRTGDPYAKLDTEGNLWFSFLYES